MRLNGDLFSQLQSESPSDALGTYRRYLMKRNASYLRLEAEAGTGFQTRRDDPDPFDAPTGYHKIAVEVMLGLVSKQPRTVIVNVPNGGSVEDMRADDIVEVPCQISMEGVKPSQVGALPESVRGLVLAVKAYERSAIRAAIEESWPMALLAMLEYPIIGQWEIAEKLRATWRVADPEHLGYLRN